MRARLCARQVITKARCEYFIGWNAWRRGCQISWGCKMSTDLRTINGHQSQLHFAIAGSINTSRRQQLFIFATNTSDCELWEPHGTLRGLSSIHHNPGRIHLGKHCHCEAIAGKSSNLKQNPYQWFSIDITCISYIYIYIDICVQIHFNKDQQYKWMVY